jgi:ABC-type glycerol-3-phosphate transport system substrate-binding protein
MVKLALTGLLTLLLMVQQQSAPIQVWIAVGEDSYAAILSLTVSYSAPVELTNFDSADTLLDRLIFEMDFGTPPDAVQLPDTYTQWAIDRSTFIPISDDAQGRFSIDNTLWAAPIDPQPLILFVNRNLLDRAGIAEIPDTWADLWATCDDFRAIENPPIGCVAVVDVTTLYQHTLIQRGIPLVLPDNGRTTRAESLNTDAAPEILAVWQDMYGQGDLLLKRTSDEFFWINGTFGTQQAPYMIADAGYTEIITDIARGKFIVETPTPPETMFPYGLVSGLWATSDVGRDFVAWFNESADTPDEPADPIQYGAMFGTYPEFRADLALALDQIITGERDMQTVLDELITRNNQRLSDYNSLYLER